MENYKCKHVDEEIGCCEIRDGIADDPTCDGSIDYMWYCPYIVDEYWDEVFGED